jgi:hypothetical protein
MAGLRGGCINENFTAWARELELEHSDDGVRLDVSNLANLASNRRGRTLDEPNDP